MVIPDTSILIPLRDGDARIETRMRALADDVRMSAISRVELEGGAYKDPAFTTIRRALVEQMLLVIPVLPFDEESALEYGRVIAQVGYSRRKILDRMIGAQARLHRATLITLNPADFNDIPGLRVEAW